MLHWLQRFENRSRLLFVSASLTIVAVVGIVDYLTGSELSFSVFYLLAVGLATWFVGRKFALFVSLLSVVVSLAGDLAAGVHYSHALVPWWNASIALLFYLVVVGLLAKLRELYKDLEARVRQRTAALSDEMAERESLEHELLEISEQERRRIGHDLHDSLGQHLTGTALAARVVEEKLRAQGLPAADDAKTVVGLVEDGIALTRSLAKGLHPIEMEAEGLMEALEELAAKCSELFRISCRFDCDSPVLIRAAGTSGHLYRIAQEAVSNAVKHGKARHVTIRLDTLSDGIALRVTDDGVGLPDPTQRSAGMGLRIMAHRAGIIGAQFTAEREASGGTTITCILSSRERSGKALP